MTKTLSPANVFIASSAVAVEPADQTATASHEGAKIAFGLLWLFTFVVFARPQDLFPVVGSLHLTLLSGTCAGLAYLGALVQGRTRLQWSNELTLVLLLTVWFTLGVPFAYWRGGSFVVLTQTWLKTLLIFFLLSQTLTTVGRVRKILWAVLLSELVVSCASIMQQAKPELQEGGRLAGVNQVFLGWNFFGITVSITLPFIAFLYVSRRSAVRTSLLLAVTGFSMWMLVLTASRGGFLNMVFSIILTWWFLLRGSRRGRVVGIFVAICLVVAVARAPDVFWLRLRTTWSGSGLTSNETSLSAEESTKGREFLFRRSIEYTLQHPIFGVGLGNFPGYNAGQIRRSDAWYGTHNTFTELSSEAGIPALVLFLLLLFTMLRHMKRLGDELAEDPANDGISLLARATLVSALSFAFAGIFAHLAYEYLFYYVAGIAVALEIIGRRRAGAPQDRAEPRERLAAIPPIRRIPKWS